MCGAASGSPVDGGITGSRGGGPSPRFLNRSASSRLRADSAVILKLSIPCSCKILYARRCAGIILAHPTMPMFIRSAMINSLLFIPIISFDYEFFA
jgi:hypothetical protein